jgi:hypothetical protein
MTNDAIHRLVGESVKTRLPVVRRRDNEAMAEAASDCFPIAGPASVAGFAQPETMLHAPRPSLSAIAKPHDAEHAASFLLRSADFALAVSAQLCWRVPTNVQPNRMWDDALESDS